VVVCALGVSRAGAGTLVFSKGAPDILAGLWRSIGASLHCLRCSSPTARGRCTLAVAGRRSRLPASAASRARLAHLRAGRRPGQGARQAPAGVLETSFEPGRVFAVHVDLHEQLDR
jgi:hypothetical protein